MVPVPNPNLIDTLERHGVSFQGKVESRWLQHFLSNWILPIVFMFLLWGFVPRLINSGCGESASGVRLFGFAWHVFIPQVG